MKYKVSGVTSKPAKEYDTMLEALEDNRVMSVESKAGGHFEITEECDCYFSVHVTPEQLRALAGELFVLSHHWRLKSDACESIEPPTIKPK